MGKVASASCGKDGGVDSNVLINTFGFAFIHMQIGGPFNSVKISTRRHIPGIIDATRTLRAGQTVHVLWAGGEIRNVNGENQLVDTGFMEGSIIPPTPLRSPPPLLIKANEIAGEAGRTLRAKSLQGVVVRFERVVICQILEREASGLLRVRFSDDSGGEVSAIILSTVTTFLQPNQKVASLRGLLHQPRAAEYEVIVELDQHIVIDPSHLFGHVVVVEAYSLPDPMAARRWCFFVICRTEWWRLSRQNIDCKPCWKRRCRLATWSRFG